jgi:outer membrane protein assembly factor BamA
LSEVSDRVKEALQERGYFKAQISAENRTLTSTPVSERIAVAFQIVAGQQYRLSEITFRNYHSISNLKALRGLFRIKDGEVLNLAMVRKGIDNLGYASRELGFINFTAVPDTRINDEGQSIAFDIDIHEGKISYVSSINALGLRDQNALKDLHIKHGDIYNQRLAYLFLQEHVSLLPANASVDSRIRIRQIRQDQGSAAIAITFDFRPCPVD